MAGTKPAADEQIAEWERLHKAPLGYVKSTGVTLVHALIARIRVEQDAANKFMETWKLAVSDYDNQVTENAQLKAEVEALKSALEPMKTIRAALLTNQSTPVCRCDHSEPDLGGLCIRCRRFARAGKECEPCE